MENNGEALFNTLLRTRGGISFFGGLSKFLTHSSPHTRRYFHPILPCEDSLKLFSAHAEVFPGQPTP